MIVAGFPFGRMTPPADFPVRQISPGLRIALAPLVRLSRRLSLADRRAWLDQLRSGAPVLADALEELLADDEEGEPDLLPAPVRSGTLVAPDPGFSRANGAAQ